MNRIARCLALLLFCLAAHNARAEPQVMGKIEAKLGGAPKIWYLLYNEDQTKHSGLWIAHGQTLRMAILGGYESRDVTFGEDADGRPTVSGTGSMLTINFGFPEGAKSVTHRLPQEGTSPVSLVYIPKVGDYSRMMSMEEGVLKVTDITFSADGEASFKGTFSGTLQGRGGEGGKVEITDGRFEVSRVRQMTHP